MQRVKSAQILGSFVFLFLIILTACRTNDAQLQADLSRTNTEVVVLKTKTPFPTISPTDEIPEDTPESPTAIVENENLDELVEELPDWYTFVPDDQFSGGYALVTVYPAVLYSSAEDAAVKGQKKRTLPGDEIYVSYSAQKKLDGVNYYEIEENGWMSGESLQKIFPSTFRGIRIRQMPAEGFGWLVVDSFSYRSVNDETELRGMGHLYKRYTLFEVFEVFTDIDGQRWYRINADEWLKDDNFSYVSNNLPPGREAAGGRWIDVNITEQNLVVYENNIPIFATLVSTGKERGWTAEGIFTIYNTAEKHGLLSPDPLNIGNYYLEDVPWILFYEGSWALHGAYWHDAFGHPNSHGCVNLSLSDAHWLFSWAKAGDWVFLFW